jgi:hypothetical protein
MSTNRRQSPVIIVSNQAPIHPVAVTLPNAPPEMVAKYRSSKPLRRPVSRKGKK